MAKSITYDIPVALTPDVTGIIHYIGKEMNYYGKCIGGPWHGQEYTAQRDYLQISNDVRDKDWFKYEADKYIPESYVYRVGTYRWVKGAWIWQDPGMPPKLKEECLVLSDWFKANGMELFGERLSLTNDSTLLGAALIIYENLIHR